jgi:predicted alpha/beta-fold hydrolase
MSACPFHAYRAPLPLRSGHLQTFLASAAFRARGPNPMSAAAGEVVVEAGDGTRLLGAHAPQAAAGPKGLAIMLHGWEGSLDSTYMLCTGRALYRRGYDVFRLNFRDHGRSHHLNPGIFYAAHLPEVFAAVRQAARFAGGRPVFLIGFSLGANFALRVALGCGREPIPGLKHVVAISPVLDPDRSTSLADRHPVIRRYFMKKWRRSLAVKQALFPGLYDFGPLLKLKTIRATTAALLKRYSGYLSERDYFRAYTLTGDALSGLPLPATLLTAADDPIIPVADFQRLRLPPSARLVVCRHGGHIGFLEGNRLRSRYEQGLPDLFDALLPGAPGPSPKVGS